MSLFSSCNFNGKVSSDIAVTNANLGRNLRVTRADICEEEVENSVINNLTVNNITTNTINVIDNSYQTGVLVGTFQHPMIASVATYNSSLASKIPLTAGGGAGTSLIFSGNDVVVQQTGVYTISYNLIYNTWGAGPTLNPLGAPGNLSNSVPAVQGRVQSFIAINNNLTTSALNAFSSFNAQLQNLPFTSGSVTLVLNAGDIISLYSYGIRNSAGVNDTVTAADGNLTVVAST